MHGVEEIQNDKQQSTSFWKRVRRSSKGLPTLSEGLKTKDSRVNKNRPLIQKQLYERVVMGKTQS